MSLRHVPLDSEALRANLARTAHTVAIPERYLSLVAAVEEYYGVRNSVDETLTEYFHPYQNVDTVIEGLETLMLRNWSYLEKTRERVRHFSLIAELVVSLLEKPLSQEQTSILIRLVSTWCHTALTNSHAATYREPIARIGTVLGDLVPKRPIAFLERDTLLRNLTREAMAAGDDAASFVELYRFASRIRLSAARKPP